MENKGGLFGAGKLFGIFGGKDKQETPQEPVQQAETQPSVESQQETRSIGGVPLDWPEQSSEFVPQASAPVVPTAPAPVSERPVVFDEPATPWTFGQEFSEPVRPAPVYETPLEPIAEYVQPVAAQPEAPAQEPEMLEADEQPVEEINAPMSIPPVDKTEKAVFVSNPNRFAPQQSEPTWHEPEYLVPPQALEPIHSTPAQNTTPASRAVAWNSEEEAVPLDLIDESALLSSPVVDEPKQTWKLEETVQQEFAWNKSAEEPAAEPAGQPEVAEVTEPAAPSLQVWHTAAPTEPEPVVAEKSDWSGPEDQKSWTPIPEAVKADPPVWQTPAPAAQWNPGSSAQELAPSAWHAPETVVPETPLWNASVPAVPDVVPSQPEHSLSQWPKQPAPSVADAREVSTWTVPDSVVEDAKPWAPEQALQPMEVPAAPETVEAVVEEAPIEESSSEGFKWPDPVLPMPVVDVTDEPQSELTDEELYGAPMPVFEPVVIPAVMEEASFDSVKVAPYVVPEAEEAVAAAPVVEPEVPQAIEAVQAVEVVEHLAPPPLPIEEPAAYRPPVFDSAERFAPAVEAVHRPSVFDSAPAVEPEMSLTPPPLPPVFSLTPPPLPVVEVAEPVVEAVEVAEPVAAEVQEVAAPVVEEAVAEVHEPVVAEAPAFVEEVAAVVHEPEAVAVEAPAVVEEVAAEVHEPEAVVPEPVVAEAPPVVEAVAAEVHEPEAVVAEPVVAEAPPVVEEVVAEVQEPEPVVEAPAEVHAAAKELDVPKLELPEELTAKTVKTEEPEEEKNESKKKKPKIIVKPDAESAAGPVTGWTLDSITPNEPFFMATHHVAAPASKSKSIEEEFEASFDRFVSSNKTFKWKRIGELLKELGVLSEMDLQVALTEQQKMPRPLGQVLVDLGYVSDRLMLKVLAAQKDVVPWYFDTELESSLLALLEPDFCRRSFVLPVQLEGNNLTVAMRNPSDIDAIDHIKRVTGFEVEPALADEKRLEDAINDAFSRDSRSINTHVQALAQEAIKTSDIKAAQIDESMSLEDLEEGTRPVVGIVNKIILDGIRMRASDIHIEPTSRCLQVRYRIDGRLQIVSEIPSEIIPMVTARIKIMAELDPVEWRIPQDGRLTVEINGQNIDLRLSVLPSFYGGRIVMRILDRSIGVKKLEDIGFSEHNIQIFKTLIKRPYGLFLVTGPTGSGKTTSLYAALNAVKDEETNIITCEDPVEYNLDGISQSQVNAKIGLTFAAQLRSILRQDPDIVLVGEIRDQETAETAVRASMTGHMVFSTLHCNDAPSAVPRLLDMGIDPFLLSTSLIGVMGQRLLRVICKDCREAYVPTDEEIELLDRTFGVQGLTKLYRGAGCMNCGGSGYKGRMAVHEIMPVTHELGSFIARRAPTEEIAESARWYGYRTMQEDTIERVIAGRTTLKEAQRLLAFDDIPKIDPNAARAA